MDPILSVTALVVVVLVMVLVAAWAHYSTKDVCCDYISIDRSSGNQLLFHFTFCEKQLQMIEQHGVRRDQEATISLTLESRYTPILLVMPPVAQAFSITGKPIGRRQITTSQHGVG